MPGIISISAIVGAIAIILGVFFALIVCERGDLTQHIKPIARLEAEIDRLNEVAGAR